MVLDLEPRVSKKGADGGVHQSGRKIWGEMGEP